MIFGKQADYGLQKSIGIVVRRMNEVTLCWAQIVLGWLTVYGRVYHIGMKPSQLDQLSLASIPGC